MEITTYTPDKGRLVTVQVHYTSAANTTTDIDGDLLIHEPGYRIPLLLQGLSRAAIKHDRDKAMELDQSAPMTR